MNAPGPDRESWLRSLLKAVSYRILGTLTTTAMAYVVTGDAATSLLIGGLEPLVKTVLYYLHERAWARVPRGAVRRLLRNTPG